MNNDYDYCIHCGCDLTNRDDGDDTCCWCLERIEKEEPTDDEMKSSFGTKWHDGL